MGIAPVNVTTVNFQGTDATASSLRRLAQDLQIVERALNNLISIQNTASTNPDDNVPPHVLATTTGLNTDHTVSGLTAGQVLKAISATNAAFQNLAFGDLEGSDITDDPENGDFIQFVDGFWVATPAPPGGSTGMNIGAGAGIYASNSGAVLQFKGLLSVAGIAISSTVNSIILALDPVPATAALNLFTTLLQGLVPPSGAINGFFLRDDGTWAAVPLPQFVLSAGWNSSSGAVPTASAVPQDVLIPYGSTLQEVYIQTQGGTGSCTVTLGTQSFPISAPTDITGGIPPAIVSGVSYSNTSLVGWTTTFSQGDMIRATLTANTGFTSVKIMLRLK